MPGREDAHHCLHRRENPSLKDQHVQSRAVSPVITCVTNETLRQADVSAQTGSTHQAQLQYRAVLDKPSADPSVSE